METTSKTTIKTVAKKAALIAVDTIAAPLHIGLQLTSNVVQLAADSVAMGEGYITEKIDSTQDREEIANKRVQYTQEKFLHTAMELENFKNKVQHKYNQTCDKLKDLTTKKPAEPVYAVPEQGVQFRVKEFKVQSPETSA